MRLDEQSFLRTWAGTSLMPALLVWGMRHGHFTPSGDRLSVTEISLRTGYTTEQVRDMLETAERLIVKETENEVSDKPRPDAWWRTDV